MQKLRPYIKHFEIPSDVTARDAYLNIEITKFVSSMTNMLPRNAMRLTHVAPNTYELQYQSEADYEAPAGLDLRGGAREPSGVEQNGQVANRDKEAVFVTGTEKPSVNKR